MSEDLPTEHGVRVFHAPYKKMRVAEICKLSSFYDTKPHIIQGIPYT